MLDILLRSLPDMVRYVKALMAKYVFVVCLSVHVLHMMSQHMILLRQYLPELTKHYYCPDLACIDSYNKSKATYYRGIIMYIIVRIESPNILYL